MHLAWQCGGSFEGIRWEVQEIFFSEYDPVFVDMVSSAASLGNLNFSLKKEQMQIFSEISFPCGIGLEITALAFI